MHERGGVPQLDKYHYVEYIGKVNSYVHEFTFIFGHFPFQHSETAIKVSLLEERGEGLLKM